MEGIKMLKIEKVKEYGTFLCSKCSTKMEVKTIKKDGDKNENVPLWVQCKICKHIHIEIPSE